MGELIRGPWKPQPNRVDASKVRWRKGRPIDEPRVKCVDCDRPFSPKAWVPVDRVCADCRDARAVAEAAALPPTLFDPEQPER